MRTIVNKSLIRQPDVNCTKNMAEMPIDVLPDPSPAGSEPEKTQTPVTDVPAPTPPAPATQKGDKTPPENLFHALEEERKLRKEAEDRLRIAEEQLIGAGQPEEVFSDEGKVLDQKISKVESELVSLKEEKEIEKICEQYPVLKDSRDEFDEFRKDYPRHKLANVAKIFLSEKGLLDSVPPRPGLERPVAGTKTLPSPGMTSEEVAKLRKTNYRKYLELLTSGKIKPEDIK